jgi:hypothetical protein
MHAWHTAVQFLLIDNKAQALAEAHPLLEDGRCAVPGCTAAALADEALAVLARASRERPKARAGR